MDEVFLNVTPQIKNVGRTTAVHIRIQVQLVIHRWANGWGDFTPEQNATCESLAKSENGSTDIVLFPDDPFDGMGHGSGVILTPSNISSTDGTKYVAPAFVGCIDYQFQTSRSHHQTSFAYEIVRADNRSRIFVLGEDMPTAQLKLIRDAQYDHAD